MTINKRKNQISVTLPTDVIEKADRDAKKETRTRAGVLAKIIIQHYQGEKK